MNEFSLSNNGQLDTAGLSNILTITVTVILLVVGLYWNTVAFYLFRYSELSKLYFSKYMQFLAIIVSVFLVNTSLVLSVNTVQPLMELKYPSIQCRFYIYIDQVIYLACGATALTLTLSRFTHSRMRSIRPSVLQTNPFKICSFLLLSSALLSSYIWKFYNIKRECEAGPFIDQNYVEYNSINCTRPTVTCGWIGPKTVVPNEAIAPIIFAVMCLVSLFLSFDVIITQIGRKIKLTQKSRQEVMRLNSEAIMYMFSNCVAGLLNSSLLAGVKIYLHKFTHVKTSMLILHKILVYTTNFSVAFWFMTISFTSSQFRHLTWELHKSIAFAIIKKMSKPIGQELREESNEETGQATTPKIMFQTLESDA